MKRSAVTKLAGVSVLVAVCAATLLGQPMVPDKGTQQPDYFPIALGNKWHMQIENNGVKASAMLQVVKVETIAGQTKAHLEESLMGKKSLQDGEISTSDKGVYLHKIEPPVCLLKYPVTEGETWRAKSKINGVEFLVISAVGKWEQVEVPAGKFKAIKVRVEYDEQVAPFSTDYWFAADVGIIMTKTSSLKGTQKLAKFEKESAKK